MATQSATSSSLITKQDVPFHIGALVVSLVLVVVTGAAVKPHSGANKFFYPLVVAVAMFVFYRICTRSEVLVDAINNYGDDPKSPLYRMSKFAGIFALVAVAIILLAFNAGTMQPKLNSLFKRRMKSKPNFVGVFLTLGAGAIVFGFLDNFGMKLGTDALEGSVFMPMGKKIIGTKNAVEDMEAIKKVAARIDGAKVPDAPYNYKDFGYKVKGSDVNTLSSNIDVMDEWSGGQYNKVINQATRLFHYNAETGEYSGPTGNTGAMTSLMDTLTKEKFKPLQIPEGMDEELTRVFLKDLRTRFNTIKDASSMLGNTFSDFVGALLGAGVGKLFAYLTSYDGDVNVDDDDKSINSTMIRLLQNPVVKVILEAFFIAIGCLIPVWMHYHNQDQRLHHTGVKTYEKPALLFVLVCILAAGFLTEPIPDEDVEAEEPSKRSNENFAVSMTGCVVFSVLLAYGVHRMAKKKETA